MLSHKNIFCLSDCGSRSLHIYSQKSGGLFSTEERGEMGGGHTLRSTTFTFYHTTVHRAVTATDKRLILKGTYAEDDQMDRSQVNLWLNSNAYLFKKKNYCKWLSLIFSYVGVIPVQTE